MDATSLPVELEPGPPSEKLTCQTFFKREREKKKTFTQKENKLIHYFLAFNIYLSNFLSIRTIK